MARRVDFIIKLKGSIVVNENTHDKARIMVQEQMCLGELLEDVDLSDYAEHEVTVISSEQVQ